MTDFVKRNSSNIILFLILLAGLLVILLGTRQGTVSYNVGVKQTPLESVLDCVCVCSPKTSISPTPTATPTALLPEATPQTPKPVLPTVTSTPSGPHLDWQVPSTIPIYISHSTLTTRYWRIIAVRFEDIDRAGGRHNVYYRLENPAGSVYLGQHVCLSWPSGSDCTHVTEIHDQYYPAGYYADQPLYGGSWKPEDGPGPYNASVSVDSDYLMGMGLPYYQHVNYYVTWRWQP